MNLKKPNLQESVDVDRPGRGEAILQLTHVDIS